MQVDDDLIGDLPNPYEERHGRVAGVIFNPSRCFQPDILQHVSSVDSSVQAAIEPETHHSLQLVAMLREDFSDRVGVSRL